MKEEFKYFYIKKENLRFFNVGWFFIDVSPDLMFSISQRNTTFIQRAKCPYFLISVSPTREYQTTHYAITPIVRISGEKLVEQLTKLGLDKVPNAWLEAKNVAY